MKILVEYYKELERKKQHKKWLSKQSQKLPRPKKSKKQSKKKPPRHAKTNDFYKSREWKQLRYEVLRERGNRCEVCGISPSDTPLGYIVVDHILPATKFPARRLEKSNLQILCNDCNMGKSNRFYDDWRPETAKPASHSDILKWLDK